MLFTVVIIIINILNGIRPLPYETFAMRQSCLCPKLRRSENLTWYQKEYSVLPSPWMVIHSNIHRAFRRRMMSKLMQVYAEIHGSDPQLWGVHLFHPFRDSSSHLSVSLITKRKISFSKGASSAWSPPTTIKMNVSNLPSLPTHPLAPRWKFKFGKILRVPPVRIRNLDFMHVKNNSGSFRRWSLLLALAFPSKKCRRSGPMRFCKCSTIMT